MDMRVNSIRSQDAAKRLKIVWLILVTIVFISLICVIAIDSPDLIWNFKIYLFAGLVAGISGLLIYLFWAFYCWIYLLFGRDQIVRGVKKVIYLALIVIGVVIIYYIASPYQNCVAEAKKQGRQDFIFCSRITRW